MPPELQESAVHSLRQYASRKDSAEFAVPALFLLLPNSGEAVAKFLRYVQTHRDAAVRRRVLEAFRWVLWNGATAPVRPIDSRLERELLQTGIEEAGDGMRFNPHVQLPLIELLRDPDPTGRTAGLARDCLVGRRKEGALIPGNFLSDDALAALEQMLRFPRRDETRARILAMEVLGRNEESVVFSPFPRGDKAGSREVLVQRLLSNEPKESAAAAAAFERIKPEDEKSQLGLVEAIARRDIPLETAQLCFRALGLNDKYKIKRWIQSEEVLEKLAQIVSDLTFHKDGGSALREARTKVAGVLELLVRNPSSSFHTAFLLCATYRNLLPRRASLRMDASLGRLHTILTAKSRLKIEGTYESALELAQLLLYADAPATLTLLERIQITPSVLSDLFLHLMNSDRPEFAIEALSWAQNKLSRPQQKEWIHNAPAALDTALANRLPFLRKFILIAKACHLPVEALPQTFAAMIQLALDHPKENEIPHSAIHEILSELARSPKRMATLEGFTQEIRPRLERAVKVGADPDENPFFFSPAYADLLKALNRRYPEAKQCPALVRQGTEAPPSDEPFESGFSKLRLGLLEKP